MNLPRQKSIHYESEFDAYHESYSAIVNRSIAFSGLTGDFFTRVKIDYLVTLIGKLRPPAAQAEILDVGCGVGNAHALLRGRVGRIAGIDVSTACISKAAERNPDNEYSPFDGLNLPYESASFDVASAACVFHHVPVLDRLRLAQDVRRVLRSGGLLVIFEHNPLNPLTRYAVDNCEFDRDAVLLRKTETERLLNEAGFGDVQSRFILAVPPLNRTLGFFDRLFGRIPLGAQYFTVGRRS